MGRCSSCGSFAESSQTPWSSKVGLHDNLGLIIITPYHLLLMFYLLLGFELLVEMKCYYDDNISS